MAVHLQPGKLVSLRGRDWVVLPSDDPDMLVVKPLGGADDETTGIYLPFGIDHDRPKDARFPPPAAADLGDIATARLLYESARLAFRNGAGPFRALAKLSFRPRAYQIVPLVMALRQDIVRLLIADDVGVGKTIEALLLTRELMERRRIRRFAVICLPHLCDQWQQEIRDKLDIEAVIIRSSTQARLDRQIQGDTSVYEYYPYQIISVDYIKAANRRDVFVQQAPDLVIVDEAHACARPEGASEKQQQRYHLLSRLAAKPEQHLVMLTATPHSGKQEEFHSILGLLKREFESIDLPSSSQAQRRELAKHFVQRKRADVEKWLGEDTPFPTREAFEVAYGLTASYASFYDDMLGFARKLVSADPSAGPRRTKAHYWTALALLRGVMSSPAAGVTMLTTRLDKLRSGVGDTDDVAATAGADGPESPDENPVADTDDVTLADTSPTQLVESGDWTDVQKRQLRDLAKSLGTLTGTAHDAKLKSLFDIVDDWLAKGIHPVVFCRFIPTANYLGEQLRPLLAKKYPKLDLQVVTSEDPDEIRKDRIKGMEPAKQRVLIATDCLSEGINLQTLFTGVIHYDLPWNPNRLEQREGRVDRFGQTAKTVKACLLYGADNPIDGVVLDILLRKVREIKKATGINVPFPEDSQSIIDTITQALLLNPDRKIAVRQGPKQSEFDFSDCDEAKTAEIRVSRKIQEAAEREKISRGIFAQNAIQAAEIEQDLKTVDEAIGDPHAVERFVVGVLQNLLGVQVTKDKKEDGFHIVAANLPPQLQVLLPEGQSVAVSFASPAPKGFLYLGRNNRFVEQLCQIVMANTLARQGAKAARAAVIRTRDVPRKTTLLLFRCRNVIEQARDRHPNANPHQIVAEEMLLWGWRGTLEERDYLSHETAKDLLTTVRASSDLTPQARTNFLVSELDGLAALDTRFEKIAEEQSKRLVAAHERFSALMDKARYQVVYPVLPMDLLGIYVLLPEVAPAGGKS
jgi:superfamily II DNA or RNA helicase